ncbi:MAG: LysE family transporter [archaeon]|nr:LysE family transporter [archaeon]
MIWWIIFSGIFVGLTSGIPLGPAGAYCIKKSLINKKYGGYLTGFGAATADGLFALVAAFGITAISKFLIAHQFSINSVGGLFLIGVGLKEFGSRISLNNGIENGKKDFFSGFTIALASPFVIFSFLALYAILGLAKISGDYSLSLLLATSTLFGAFLGISILNWIVIKYRNKIEQKTINQINKVIGLIIFGTGAYLLMKGLFL